MSDWGMKVSKPGAEVTSINPRDLRMSSSFSMLKFHSDNTNTITLNPGDTDSHVDFTHTLGYVPAFIAYWEDFNGKQRFIPSTSAPTSFLEWPYAYADSSKIRAGYYVANGYNSPSVDASDWWFTILGSGNTFVLIGNYSGSTADGAFRFSNVAIPNASSITNATIHFYVDSKGATTTSLKFKVWGIAEDNTSSFGSDPMGRTKTTATGTFSTSMSTAVPFFFGIDVTSEVQEIVNRAGWASGNAMGFLLQDNGSDNNCWAGDAAGGTDDTYLTITYGSGVVLTLRVIIFKDKLA